MAVTKARIGLGTLLKKGDGTIPTEVFTTVAEVKSITPPQSESDDIDVTHMESPGGYREYIMGLKEPGEAEFEINWIPDDPTHDETTGLLADAASGEVHNWQIVLPGAILTWEFTGYVKTFNPEIPVDGALTATVTIKVSGSSTYTAGTMRVPVPPAEGQAEAEPKAKAKAEPKTKAA